MFVSFTYSSLVNVRSWQGQFHKLILHCPRLTATGYRLFFCSWATMIFSCTHASRQLGHRLSLLFSVHNVVPSLPSENYPHLTVTRQTDQTGGIRTLIHALPFYTNVYNVYKVKALFLCYDIFTSGRWSSHWADHQLTLLTNLMVPGWPPSYQDHKTTLRSQIGWLVPALWIVQT